jgi:peptidoglycan hydrolase CwlO-like protein
MVLGGVMDWDAIIKVIGGLVTGGALVAFYNLFRAGPQNSVDKATAAEKISTVSLDWVHEFSGQLKDAVTRIDALEAENQAKDTKIAEQDKKIEALTTENKELRGLIADRDKKISEMQGEIIRLQARRPKKGGMLT